MSTPPKRQILRQRQNEILSALTKNMQESLDCQEIHTEILKKKANKKAKHKIAAKEMICGDRTIRILVVDSEDDIFRITRDELEFVNGTVFETIKATSYEQVVSAIKEKRFDVILMDCHSLLGQEPFLLIRQARKKNKYVPIIVYGPEDSRECDYMALEAGADDYLIRSDITAKLLEKSIRYSLSKKS